MCDEQHRHGTHARHSAYLRRRGLQNTHTEAVVFRACATRPDTLYPPLLQPCNHGFFSHSHDFCEIRPKTHDAHLQGIFPILAIFKFFSWAATIVVKNNRHVNYHGLLNLILTNDHELCINYHLLLIYKYQLMSYLDFQHIICKSLANDFVFLRH